MLCVDQSRPYHLAGGPLWVDSGRFLGGGKLSEPVRREGMKNFTYGRGADGVQLMTMRGHRLSEMCADEAGVEKAVRLIKDELDQTAHEMKAALKGAVEIDK